LGAYLVDVSEALEIVHLERAELVLYGVEDVGDRHAELLRLDAVEVDVEGGRLIWWLVKLGPSYGAFCAAATEPREREPACRFDLHHHPIPDDLVQ
jgi:hypothetical protein